MKKGYKIISVVFIVVIALGLWVLYLYVMPPQLPTYEKKNVDSKILQELGYVPGEIIISIKRSEMDLSTNIGLRRFLSFLDEKSSELTPIIINQLNEKGKLLQAEITPEFEKKMKSSLITYGRSFSSTNGALLVLGINDAVLEIIDELKKEDFVEDVNPNFVINNPKVDFVGSPK